MVEIVLRNPVLVAALLGLGLVVVVVGSRHGRQLRRPLPLLILLGGWSASAMLFVLGSREQARAEAADLALLAGEAQAAMEQRLTTYVDGLRSGASFLMATPGIGRTQWSHFASTLDLQGRYPGVNGIGVIYPVTTGDSEQFVRRARSDGAPDFTIHSVPGFSSPVGADQYVITFIEPLDGNRAARGLDVASESNRRRAAEEARDTGEPRLTGRIVLVQDGKKRPGFLLYVPVYRLGVPLATTAERRAALQAWVYAPFVTEQFVASVLKGNTGALDLQLFERGGVDVAHRLFSSGVPDAAVSTFALMGTLRMAGEEFTLGWNRGRDHPPVHQGPLSWIGALFAVVTVLVAWLAYERMKADESERRYRTLVEWVPEPLYVVRDGKLAYLNPAAVKLFGARSAHDVLGTALIERVHPESRQAAAARLALAAEGEALAMAEMQLIALDATPIAVESHETVIELDGTPAVLALVRDVTEMRRATAAAAAVESELQHAQKLESVGRLAGGIAHDFNNMLGVILGNTEIAMEQLDPAHPVQSDLHEIRKAALRSADITRQLLAFARKEAVAPIALSVNDNVPGLLSMLQRLIGEDIQVRWEPAPWVWPVTMDPSQLANVLTNLCLNARDAIADVGTITLSSENVVADAAFCAAHPSAVPGEFVRLRVRDTGRGMDAHTMGRIFDPFFTTKEMGRGTGLGLASVYGALQQNDGFVTVVSAEGAGSTFDLYLPRTVVPSDAALRQDTAAALSVHGHETILLVEDEPAILRLLRRALEAQGYSVLAAEGPGEALRQARECAGDIHLLVSDVTMPGMNGRDLAKALLAHRPQMRQLFISGHTAEAVVGGSGLASGVDFLEKPFSVIALGAKVREVLDRGRGPWTAVSSGLRVESDGTLG